MRAQLALVLVPWCPLLATRQMSPCRTLEGLNGKMCELLHTSLVVQKMQGVRAMLGTKRPQPLKAGASKAERIEGTIRPYPLCRPRAERFILLASMICGLVSLRQRFAR